MAENHNWLELTTLYMNELSATSRTMLGLSSGGVGLLIGLFRDPHSTSVRWGIIVALCCFLFSLMSWLYFSLYSIRLRQDLAEASAKSWTAQMRDMVGQREREMLNAFRIQQSTFVAGVVTASIAVIIELTRGH